MGQLEKFFAGFTNPDGSLAGGINHYAAPDDFRQQLEHHMRDRLDKLLELLPATDARQAYDKTATTPIWPASPYSGLEAFTPEQAPIFFGCGQEIGRVLLADASVAQKHLTQLLAQHQTANELLLVVDQFEELFTQTTGDERKDFLKLLVYLVAQPRVCIIVTLRADFYARAIEEPSLARLLRRDRGTFPLDPPGLSAIHLMIIRPAEAAGVELEEELAQRLLDDAGEGQDRQPTLEVAHETVLIGWDRLNQWIREHAETLRARRDLERVATEWHKSSRHGSALRTGKLLQRYLSSAEPHSNIADEYLSACKRRRTGLRIGYAMLENVWEW